MIENTETNELVLSTMAEFLLQEEVGITDAGTYPLITFSSLYDLEAMTVLKENGEHLRTAVQAARQGIPVAKWPLKLINLSNPHDVEKLKNRVWTVDWNGIWIHSGHGEPGFCHIVKPQPDGKFISEREFGLTFYNKFAKHILDLSQFQYAVFNTCDSMVQMTQNTGILPSFVEMLRKTSRKPTIRIYGAHAKTWTPLYGPHRGKILIGHDPFWSSCDGVERKFSDYYTGSLIMLQVIGYNFISKNHELEYSGALTERYFAEAEFNVDNTASFTTHEHNALANTKWYYVR